MEVLSKKRHVPFKRKKINSISNCICLDVKWYICFQFFFYCLRISHKNFLSYRISQLLSKYKNKVISRCVIKVKSFFDITYDCCLILFFNLNVIFSFAEIYWRISGLEIKTNPLSERKKKYFFWKETIKLK